MTAVGELCDNAARLEIARTSLYTPIVGDGSELRPVEMISYNFVNGTHFRSFDTGASGQGAVFPTFLDQLTTVGYRLLATCLNAVAFMNHVKGDRVQTHGNLRVRTFFEKLKSRAASGVVEGWRIFHMLCPVDGSAPNGTGDLEDALRARPLVAARAEESAFRSTGAVSDLTLGGTAQPRGDSAMILDVAANATAAKALRDSDSSSSSSGSGISGVSSSSDDSEGENSSQAEEVSANVDEADEEAVARSDARRAKKKSKPAKLSKKQQTVEQLKRFAGGFETAADEARTYMRSMKSKGSEAARTALIKGYPTSGGADAHAILRRTKAIGANEYSENEARLIEMLKQQTIADQFMTVILPYLAQDGNAHRTAAELAAAGSGEGVVHAFIDSRTCTNPQLRSEIQRASDRSASLSLPMRFADIGGRIDPDRVLGPVTSMAYHTEGIDPKQCDLASYFDILPEDADTVLSLMDNIGNEEILDDGGDNSALREHYGDAMDIDDGDRIAFAAEQRSNMGRTRADRLHHAFTKHSRRIELMERAGVKTAQFRHFPCPTTVYELRETLCRPETVPILPLPHEVGVPVPIALTATTAEGAERELAEIAHDRVGLADARFIGHVINMVSASTIIADNARGIACAPRAAHSRAEMNRRAAELGDVLTKAYSSLSRDSVLPRALTTAENTCLASLALIDARADLRITARTRYAYMMTASLNYRYHDLCTQSTGKYDFDRALHTAFVNDQTVGSVEPETAREEIQRDARSNGLSPAEIERQFRETLRLGQLMAELRNAVDTNTTAVADRADRIRAAPTGAGARSQDELFEVSTTTLSSIPADIIERDDALQMNIANTRRYMALNREFTHTNNTDAKLYETRVNKLACEHAKSADDAFFNSTNVDSRIQEMRKWFATLTPSQRELNFPCPTGITPFAACLLWVQATLVSPVINLSQNPTAMLINYFASLHASRWYEDSNDPHLNVIMAGDGMSGKSFILNAVAYLSTPGVCNVTDHMSTHAMHVKKNMDGFCYIIHEMQHRFLFPAMAAKDGGAAESGDALTFFKARLTKGRSSIMVLKMNKETGDRDVEMFESSNQGVTLAATNDSLTYADENLLSRFIVLSVPKPRDQAEGCSAADRENTDERENIKVTDEHYKDTVKRSHQLVRFRCAYAEFMIKSGVLPNGFMSGGARLLIDAVLTEMEQSHSVETRDPRRRKITEEMARSLALFYSQWMSLGTPYARKYASSPGAPDLWSWKAFMDISVPFMYTPKEAAVAALTMLETIWSPNYYSRILYGMAFGVAHIHELDTKSFLHNYRHRPASVYTDAPESSSLPPGPVNDPRATQASRSIAAARGGAANTHDVEIDYDYVVIEGDSDQAIYRGVADQCSRFGIRTADIETFVARQCKQYISTRHLVLKPYEPVPITKPEVPTAPKPGAPAGMPLSANSAFLKPSVAPNVIAPLPSLGQMLRSAVPMSEGPSESVDDYDTIMVDAPSDMSRESAMVAAMDARLDAEGYERASTDVPLPAASKRDHDIGKTVYGTDAIKIIEDESRPVARIPVMIRGSKNPSRPNEGRQLRIATAFLMQRLGFNVGDAKTMRELVAAERTKVHDPMPDVQIEVPKKLGELAKAVRAARVQPPETYGWGDSSNHDFAKRMKAARELGVVRSDDTSPMARSIATVLENAYLNRAALADTETQDMLDRISEEHDKEFRENPDPSKDETLRYPWHTFVTCYPSGDYVIKSADRKRHPNGRHLAFYDLLKVMPLHCDPRNKTPLHRINYAQLDAMGRELLDPMPIGEAGEDYAQAERLVLASERTRVLRGAHGVCYTADVDYYEARERMSSICHPGMPLMHDVAKKLGAWTPITYQFMRNLTLTMIENQQMDPRPRATVTSVYADPNKLILYPEQDPRIVVEYPSIIIAARIRAIENIDRCENVKDYSHLVTADAAYMLDDHHGQLAFYNRDRSKPVSSTVPKPSKMTRMLDAAITSDSRGPFVSPLKRACAPDAIVAGTAIKTSSKKRTFGSSGPVIAPLGTLRLAPVSGPAPTVDDDSSLLSQLVSNVRASTHTANVTDELLRLFMS